MGQYTIGLIGHGGGGKTSLAESLLYLAGALKKLGSVDDGTSMMDFEIEEKERKSSLSSALAFLRWKDHQVDFIDSPGSMNFIGSTMASIRVIDSALMVCSAEPGIQSQTELLWEMLDQSGTPRMVILNKMDREQADFSARLATLNEVFSNKLVPLNIPIGKAENFKGMVDLIEMCGYDYGTPEKPRKIEIPPEMQEEIAEHRDRLIEAAAEGNDDLLEKYLETENLDEDDMKTGIREATLAGKMVPVLCASSTNLIGIDIILNNLVDYLPDFETRFAHKKEDDSAPEGFVADTFENKNFSAFVFKTKIDHFAGKLSIIRLMSGELKPATEIFNSTSDDSERPAHLFKMLGKDQQEVKSLRPGELGALPKLNHTATGNTLCTPKNKIEYSRLHIPQPVLTYAMHLTGKGEEEKLSSALHRMMDEDPTLSFRHSSETGDFLVGGMGQIHLEMVLERLKREFNINAYYEVPLVPYRETIRLTSKAQGKYKKQTGGRGQYGDCWVELKPNGTADGLVFHNAIVGGVIPRTYIPAVEKGIIESMKKGIISGFPVIGIDAKVYDGSYHDVDSSEMAFKIAGSMAFKKAMEDARPILLEPIMEMEVVVNSDYTGDVMGDINSRRGKVLGMDTKGRNQVVRVEVPMGEALTYAIDLRAMTSGQGYFTQKFLRYDECPPQISEKVVKSRQGAAKE